MFSSRQVRVWWLSMPLSLLLAACGGSSGGGSPAPGPGDPFAAVDALAGDTFRAQGISGMGLVIYDQAGRKVFEKMYGDFSPTGGSRLHQHPSLSAA